MVDFGFNDHDVSDYQGCLHKKCLSMRLMQYTRSRGTSLNQLHHEQPHETLEQKRTLLAGTATNFAWRACDLELVSLIEILQTRVGTAALTSWNIHLNLLFHYTDHLQDTMHSGSATRYSSIELRVCSPEIRGHDTSIRLCQMIKNFGESLQTMIELYFAVCSLQDQSRYVRSLSWSVYTNIFCSNLTAILANFMLHLQIGSTWVHDHEYLHAIVIHLTIQSIQSGHPDGAHGMLA